MWLAMLLLDLADQLANSSLVRSQQMKLHRLLMFSEPTLVPLRTLLVANLVLTFNAIQLRNVSVVAPAIPEPSSLAVISMIGLGLISRRRRS